MKKRVYLKNWLERLLSAIVMLSIVFVATTIEILGNPTYNKVLVVLLIVNVIIMKVLTKFGKSFQI